MGSDPRTAGRPADQRDRGAVIVLVAALMGVVLVMVALVLDMSGARRDRDADQVAADAMALAASAGLSNLVTAEPACRAAWDYLVVNLPTAETAPPPDCGALSSACAPSTVAREIVQELGTYTITFTHPVPDGHPALVGQPASSLDGPPCDRFAVQVEQDRSNTWASGSVTIDVGAVGRYVRGVGDVDAPLILLEPTGCDVLTVGGSASLRVSSADPMGTDGGYIAIDSDGSTCASGNKVVILDVTGSGLVQADSIGMWVLETGTETMAFDVSKSGVLQPTPQASSSPVGRSAMDWRYNCDPSQGCPGSGPAHIDELVAAYDGPAGSTPPGFTRWTDHYGSTCSVTGTVVVPAGDWHIDCDPLVVTSGATLSFAGGTIVSEGSITVNSSGKLRVNCQPDGAGACPADPDAPMTWYLRSGSLVHNNDMWLYETFVYLSAGSFSTAGNGQLFWTAPDDPTYPFDDLLLWTESTTQMKVAGTADLFLEGILFAPNAQVELKGDMGGEALGAQMLVRSLDLVGGANLQLTPMHDRMLQVGKGRVMLIR